MIELSALYLFLMLLSSTEFSLPQLASSFSNSILIQQNQHFLQFYAKIKSNESCTFLRDLQLNFDYNTSAFGAEIVTNPKMAVPNLELLAGHHQIVNLAENSNSKYDLISGAFEEMSYSGSADYFDKRTLGCLGF